MIKRTKTWNAIKFAISENSSTKRRRIRRRSLRISSRLSFKQSTSFWRAKGLWLIHSPTRDYNEHDALCPTVFTVKDDRRISITTSFTYKLSFSNCSNKIRIESLYLKIDSTLIERISLWFLKLFSLTRTDSKSNRFWHISLSFAYSANIGKRVGRQMSDAFTGSALTAS